MKTPSQGVEKCSWVTMGWVAAVCGGCVGVAGQTVLSGNGCCEISDRGAVKVCFPFFLSDKNSNTTMYTLPPAPCRMEEIKHSRIEHRKRKV